MALDIRRAEQRLHARGAIDLGGADDPVVVNDAILHQKFPVLKQIEITDIPIGGRGRYRHTEMDDATQVDRNQALTMLGRGHHNPELDPKFWLNLGKLVTTPRQGRYFGRCLSCAAAVIKTLIEDPVYDDLMIEKIASPESDHHLVLLGRENADGLSMNRLAQRSGWGEAVVLDVWQGNLNGSFKYVYSEANCRYVHNKRLKFYCVFPPHKRAEHRAHLASVAALRGRNVPRVMDAILARRGQEQNAATQPYRKVTTGGVTRWVPA